MAREKDSGNCLFFLAKSRTSNNSRINKSLNSGGKPSSPGDLLEGNDLMASDNSYYY